MIGLLFLVGTVIWLTAAVMLSRRIPRWLGLTKNTKMASVLLFPLILVAPFADELIGRWQFHRLCEREAVVTLSPDWESVQRARQLPETRAAVQGYLIPIYSWSGEIIDEETGRVFLKSKSFFTPGGFLNGYVGLGLSGKSLSCHPPAMQAVQKQVNLFELLKQGESK